MRDVQTAVLRAFAEYAHSVDTRFQKLEAAVSRLETSTSRRLGELERQMVDLTIQVIALESQRPERPQ